VKEVGSRNLLNASCLGFTELCMHTPASCLLSSALQGVEATFTDKGYSLTFEETFDNQCNAVLLRVHTATGHSIYYLQEFANQKLWVMYSPNGTAEHPQGACASREMDHFNVFSSADGAQLTSTKMLLGFINPELKARAKYIRRSASANPQVR
jgi:hypothetical protein